MEDHKDVSMASGIRLVLLHVSSHRYLATVVVNGGEGLCGGVLISSRVVATAGHCVCAQRKVRSDEGRARTFIDKTTCARTATIRMVRYPREGGEKEVNDQPSSGNIIPHEQLRILYDEMGREISSNADLAAIILSDPLKGIKPIRMATEQVRYSQPVILVGYGATVLGGFPGGKRYYGFNEVASIAESGATFLVGKSIQVRRPYQPKEPLLIRTEASYSLSGDSGGPCLRERNGAMELVGIAKTHYGNQELVQFSEYTSIYFHLGWFRQQIANAGREDVD